MSLKDSLIRAVTPAPPKLIIYGPPGVGKTTLAASAQAILIDCENGAGAVPGLTRTPYLKTWPEMRQWLTELAADPPGKAGAVAVDTLDWMLQRIVEYVVMDLDGTSQGDVTNTLGTAHGGYFKAREVVQNIVYRDLLPLLSDITERGLAIILLAHAAHVKTTSPEGFDMSLAAPDLPAWIAPPFIEWADGVLYAYRDGDQRLLKTEGTNIILAKNRYSLPADLSLSWPALMQALTHTTSKKENNHG